MRAPPPLPTEAILDPYIGLRPYTDSDDDRARFKGREQDREIIIANLYAARLTVFYGASGVGKTSVLLAGVVPELRQTVRFACVVFRAWQSEKVLPSLKVAILDAVRIAAKKEIEVDAALPLDDFLLQCTQALRGHIVLIFDQFEEVLPLSRRLCSQRRVRRRVCALGKPKRDRCKLPALDARRRPEQARPLSGANSKAA